jgi:transposase
VEQSKGMLKLFYLPPNSPHLNPDETVWARVKRDPDFDSLKAK